MKTIGDRIREERMRKGFTYQQLADMSQVAMSSIASLERNYTTPIPQFIQF